MIITIFQHCCISPRRFFVSMNTGGKRCLQVIQSSSFGKQSIFSDHVILIDIMCSDCSAWQGMEMGGVQDYADYMNQYVAC